MATSTAVESFWMQVANSGLISAVQVQQLAGELADAGVVTDLGIAKQLIRRGLLTVYQAERLLIGRSRGFFFDQYKLLDLLGVGGMGWVYRAVNVQTGQVVALKVLLDQLKHDPGMLARFEQEARAGQRFHHENIVQTYGFGSAGGLPYIIMESVEGPSLLELLRLREKNRLPAEQACDIARQAALGLHQVHLAGFVHRDIKPQNLLIDQNGLVKILDFGLSMHRDGEEGDEFSMAMIFGHECVGTSAYTSPEQAIDSLQADPRSDVYSLGCTLFAALTGDTPFPFSKASDVLKGHHTQIPRNVCDVVPSIPRAVGEIVAKMLAKKPEDRFASAVEVAEALTVWSTLSPVEFDFKRILADRKKTADEKLADIQRRQRTAANSASSTARPVSASSATQVVVNPLSQVLPRGDSAAPLTGSSVARRGPFGGESPPAILVRDPIESTVPSAAHSRPALKSGMGLLPLSGGPVIPLSKDPFILGRHIDCDLQVQDASVSNRHGEFRFDGKHWTLTDLKSRNGIRVNGISVLQHRLQPGDVILIGHSLRLRFTDQRRDSATNGFSGKRLALGLILFLMLIAGLALGWTFWKR